MNPSQTIHAPSTREGSGATGWVAWPTRETWTVVGLAALAMVVRETAWLRTAAMMNDGPVFIQLAELFASGQWRAALEHPYHPLYPLAMVLAKPAFATWESAGAAVSILSGGAAVVGLYAFLRAAFDQRTAWIGALLLAVHPYAVPFSADIQSDGLYMALFLGGVALLWRALAGSGWGLPMAAGCMSGLAFLVRPEGLGILVVGGLFAGFRLLSRSWTVGRACSFAAALGLGATLLVGPYVAMISLPDGELQLTRKKSVVGIATFQPRDAEATAVAKAKAREARRARLGKKPKPKPTRPPWVDAVVELGWEAKHVFRLDHFLLMAIGIWVCRGRPGTRGGFVAAFVGIYLVVLVGLRLSAGYVSTRHVLVPLLPAIGYAAMGVPRVGEGMMTAGAWIVRSSWRPKPQSAVALGVALAATASLIMAVRPQRIDRTAVRAAAEWLAAQPLEVDRVGASKQRDAYYAGAEFQSVTRRGDVVEELRAGDTRYLIFEDSAIKRHPELAPGAHDAVRRLHREEAEGHGAVVFEILPEQTIPTREDAPKE